MRLFPYEQLIQEAEQLVRNGQDQEAIKTLASLNFVQIPREFRVKIANIFRRTSQIEMGLRLLSPIVRGRKDAMAEQATPAELAEYAILLQRFGVVSEALTILNTLEFSETPEVLLYRAFCNFNLWEYESALPDLQTYIGLALEPYAKAIGKVNISAALVFTGQFQSARELLQDTIAGAQSDQFVRLEGNCNELLAQVYIFEHKWSEAEKSLERAAALSPRKGSLERLFVDKCAAFLKSYRYGSVESLHRFRGEALAWPHPESVRDADLLSLLVKFDEAQFNHLWYGTPFPGFHRRVERLLGRRPEKESYLYGRLDSRWIEIRSGQASQPEFTLEPGSMVHRSVEALLRDFYRPLPLGSLFGMLFPGEHFNVFSSPGRVHQTLRRTRAWLNAKGVPVSIEHIQGRYRLAFSGNFSFKVGIARGIEDTDQALLARLRLAYGGESFNVQQARQKLGLSLSSVQRFLKRALNSGDIEKFGASTATSYSLKDAS